jgi:hypothetical protein
MFRSCRHGAATAPDDMYDDLPGVGDEDPAAQREVGFMKA